MPVTIRKTKRKGKARYRVSTPGGTKAKGTTKVKAKSQERLLNALEHDPDFVPGKRKKTRKRGRKRA